VAPRASAQTVCPAPASRAAINPPTAPKPTTAIFIDDPCAGVRARCLQTMVAATPG